MPLAEEEVEEEKRASLPLSEAALLPMGEKRGTMSDYCYQACAWGRGGNLCRCNAVHFAGKRSEMNPSNYVDMMSSLLYKLRGQQK